MSLRYEIYRGGVTSHQAFTEQGQMYFRHRYTQYWSADEKHN
jgi:hypothetical protein